MGLGQQPRRPGFIYLHYAVSPPHTPRQEGKAEKGKGNSEGNRAGWRNRKFRPASSPGHCQQTLSGQAPKPRKTSGHSSIRTWWLQGRSALTPACPVLSSHASGENHHLHQGHTRKPNVLPFLLNKPKQINSKEFLKYTFLLQTVLERGAVGSAKSWHEQERGAGCPGSTVTVWPPGCAHERPTAKRDHGQEGDDGAWHHTGTQHGPRQRTRRAASSRRAPGDTDADVALWTLSWWALWATPSDGSARSATSRPGGATRASPLTAWSWASRRRPCTG